MDRDIPPPAPSGNQRPSNTRSWRALFNGFSVAFSVPLTPVRPPAKPRGAPWRNTTAAVCEAIGDLEFGYVSLHQARSIEEDTDPWGPLYHQLCQGTDWERLWDEMYPAPDPCRVHDHGRAAHVGDRTGGRQ